MVGHNEIDGSILEAFPQFLAVFTGANRWRTFGQRRPISDLFGRQMEVMRTGLHAHRKSFRARGAQFGERRTGGEMDDVQTKTIFAAQRQHQPDGLQFRLVGSRLKIR